MLGKQSRCEDDIQLSLKRGKLLHSRTQSVSPKSTVTVEMKLYALDSHFIFVHILVPGCTQAENNSLFVLLSSFLDGVMDRRLMVHGLNSEIIQSFEDIDWSSFLHIYMDVVEGVPILKTDLRFFVI